MDIFRRGDATLDRREIAIVSPAGLPITGAAGLVVEFTQDRRIQLRQRPRVFWANADLSRVRITDTVTPESPIFSNRWTCSGVITHAYKWKSIS